MYWEDNKEKSGWNPMFMWEKMKYVVAMIILYPQSNYIKLHYLSNLLKRNRLGLSNENVNTYLSIVNYSHKHELEAIFSGMNAQKRFSLQMKLIGKISMGPFWSTNLKKESFMHIWENPDIYKVLDWDIIAPWDSEKNEYIAEKAKYSISYEQFRNPGKIKVKSNLEVDRAIEIMSKLGKNWKNTSYLGRSGNEYYMENGVIKVQKYNQPLK